MIMTETAILIGLGRKGYGV